ncbi:hypothetical protein RCL1_006394 [Eukaryota sp. TZLM3-RCL]
MFFPFLLLFITTALCFTATVVDYAPHSNPIKNRAEALALVKQNLDGLLSTCHTSFDIAVFPEYSITGESLHSRADSFFFATDLSDTCDILQAIQNFASIFGSTVIINIPIRMDHNVYNGALAINSDGKILAKYLKEHLYGNEVKYFDSGNPTFNDEFGHFILDQYKFFLSVCFDLMFPNLYDRISRDDDVITPIIIAPVNWVQFSPFITGSSVFNGISLFYNIPVIISSSSGRNSAGSIISWKGQSKCLIINNDRMIGQGESCSFEFPSIKSNQPSQLRLNQRKGLSVLGSNPIPTDYKYTHINQSGEYRLETNHFDCVAKVELADHNSSIILIASDGSYNNLPVQICSLMVCNKEKINDCFITNYSTFTIQSVVIELNQKEELSRSKVVIPLSHDGLIGHDISELNSDNQSFTIVEKIPITRSNIGFMIVLD